MITVYNVLLCAAIVTIIYLAAYTLVKSDSAKKVWYFAALASVFFFLLGDLLGKTSVTMEGAFFGTKVEYIGSAALTTAILLFVADFCEFKIHRVLKILLWITPVSVIVLLWTTEYHGLIYESIDFSGVGLVHLQFKSGPLHLVVHIYSLLTSLGALALLGYRFAKGSMGAVRRLNLSLLIAGIVIPLAVNIMYVLKIIPFNATPIFLTVSCVVFFFNTVKFNMLDIMPMAAKLALQSITEAFVLIDSGGRFIHSNAAAGKIFTELNSLKQGAFLSDVRHWPFSDISDMPITSDISFETPGNNHFIANISTIHSNQHLLGYIILITDVTEIINLQVEAERQNKTIIEGITYASKIQRNLLPEDTAFKDAFSDFSVIWKPRDIVGGDVYWLRNFEAGTVLCVADCTGHGTPGALLTMLVTTTLDNMVTEDNCGDTAEVIVQLDRRLSDVLHVGSESGDKRSIADIDDGCDIAVLFIAKDGSVHFSSANIPVLVCDGRNVTVHKGQKLFVGERRLAGKEEVDVVPIPASPDIKYYVASDGLFTQIGGRAGVAGSKRGKQYGFDAVKKIILQSHTGSLGEITDEIWNEYEKYRGDELRRDDFELIAFKP